MSAEVFFRGPILFLRNTEKPDAALIPDSERDVYDDTGVIGHHPDGTKAKKHYAGMLLAEGYTRLKYWDLTGKRAMVSDGSGTFCTSSSNTLIPIDAIANAFLTEPITLIARGAKDYWDRVGSEILFQGGDLRNGNMSKASFRMDTHVGDFGSAKARPLARHWVPKSGAVRIEVADHDGTNPFTVNPTDDQQVYIYNWDVQFPTVKALTEMPVCSVGEEKEDTDFKWLYQLYNPPEGKKYTDLLPIGKTLLPAPMTTCTVEPTTGGSYRPPSVGSSGCVSGTGGGE